MVYGDFEKNIETLRKEYHDLMSQYKKQTIGKIQLDPHVSFLLKPRKKQFETTSEEIITELMDALLDPTYYMRMFFIPMLDSILEQLEFQQQKDKNKTDGDKIFSEDLRFTIKKLKTIYRYMTMKEHESKLPPPEIPEQLKDNVSKTKRKQKKDNRKAVQEYKRTHPEASAREIAEKVGISSPMVYKYLAEMKENQGEKPKNSNNPKRTAVQEYKRIHPEAPAREIAEKVGIGKRMVYAYLSEMKKTET